MLMMSVHSRAFHEGFASFTSISSTSAGGSVGGPGYVAMCCNDVPSDGGAARDLTHLGTALKSALCGVGLFLTVSGTALAGGALIFIFASHSSATLASRLLEKEKVCGSTI